MKLHAIVKQTEHILRNNSPAILTALGVSGTITTAYLTGRATVKATRIVDSFESAGGTAGDRKQRIKERTTLVWKLYIPPAASCALTVGCIFGALQFGNRRTAALTAAYTLSEKAFTEYQEKVVEKIGDVQERNLRDEIAQDRANSRPVSREVVIAGPGNVLCLELYTGRYFNSDKETLMQAVNELNRKSIANMGACLSDWYSLVGLPYTSLSDDVGWTQDKLMELRFTAVFADDGRPCLAFEYNYIQPVR